MNEILKGAKTTWVDTDPWTSPDGKVTIWTVKIEQGGHEPEIMNTMSKTVAVQGFSGDLERYENAKGKTYVRQAPKEENTPGTAQFEDKQESISRSVALNNAVAYISAKKGTAVDILEAADLFLDWLQNGTKTAIKDVLEKHGLEPEFELPPEEYED